MQLTEGRFPSPPAVRSGISVHVLGAPVVIRPDGPVSGRAAHRRRLALIAILAAARGKPLGRERIMGLLWPDSPADAARHSLSEGLYVLRKDLGEESFVVQGDQVALNLSRVRIDLDEFERAVEEGRWEDAARAYAAPFLDGFYVSDAPEFERWAEGERDRLARACGRALEELALAAEAAGALLRAAEWWRRLLAHDAFSSRVALRLVRVLERAGERAAALRAAEAHVLLLRQEVGVGPDAELAALMEELRSEPPAPPARPPRAATPVAAPLAAPAERVGEADAVEPADPAVPPATSVEPGRGDGIAAEREEVAVPPVPARRRRRFGATAVAGLGTLAAVLGLMALASGGDPRPPAEPEYDPRRIAVLYLDDDSPGGDLQYLANGLTEMLIHELSQVQGLDVVSRNGVKRYRDGTLPFDTMAAELRVGSVVEGSVARSADSVRVVVQLIDANSHSHLESRMVVRPVGDLLALQRAVSEEVSGFLRKRLGAHVRLRQAERETRSPRALELALRGEEAYDDALALRKSRDPVEVASAARRLAEADALLARAERADPRWARPAVGRAMVAAQTAAWSAGDVRQVAVDSAVARAGRALARDPGNAAALEARGMAYWTAAVTPGAESGPMEQAERDLAAAVAAEPRRASAWGHLSLVLSARGKAAEADAAARRALEHDTYLEDAEKLLTRRFYAAFSRGDYRAAAEVCGQGHRAFPRDWRFVECRLTLLRADPSLPPDTALAWRLVAELDALDPPAAAAAANRAYSAVFRRMLAAAVCARAGDENRARAVLARARIDAAVDPESRVSLVYDEAVLLLLLGDRDAARERLEVYLALRPSFRGIVSRDPLVRPLLAVTPRGSQ